MSNITNLIDAARLVKDNSILALSGFSYMNPPMGIVREIIKNNVKNLTLISGPTSGIETDMLIGAGCVKKVITACVSFEKIAGVAPNFRKFAEKGDILVWECDESIWHMAIKAGIENKDYILWPGAIGTDLPRLNKDLKEVKVGSRYFLKIPAIRPDLAVVHLGYGDYKGDAALPEKLFLKRHFCEQILAKSSKDVIAEVENMVDKVDDPLITGAKVVEAEFGCHPGASNGYYIPDLDHYKVYLKYCKDEKFEDYLERYVYNVSFDEYKDIIGKKNLKNLRLR